ncbi:hypothetical protein [Paenibacillus campi]|uniref:hypothetical protein n=1 Tax=Paenibacillus campi TaxID=3106031 RepID=UPI002AFEDC78|nr:hypothetical protein [Paenibacillus sp. SGZ-1014]
MMKLHLPVCPCCQHVFTWHEAQLLRKESARHAGYCPICHASLYPTARSRSLVAGLSIVVGMIVFSVWLWSGDVSVAGLLVAVAVQMLLDYTLRPLLYSYQSYDEPLFKL